MPILWLFWLCSRHTSSSKTPQAKPKTRPFIRGFGGLFPQLMYQVRVLRYRRTRDMGIRSCSGNSS